MMNAKQTTVAARRDQLLQITLHMATLRRDLQMDIEKFLAWTNALEGQSLEALRQQAKAFNFLRSAHNNLLAGGGQMLALVPSDNGDERGDGVAGPK